MLVSVEEDHIVEGPQLQRSLSIFTGHVLQVSRNCPLRTVETSLCEYKVGELTSKLTRSYFIEPSSRRTAQHRLFCNVRVKQSANILLICSPRALCIVAVSVYVSCST